MLKQLSFQLCTYHISKSMVLEKRGGERSGVQDIRVHTNTGYDDDRGGAGFCWGAHQAWPIRCNGLKITIALKILL